MMRLKSPYTWLGVVIGLIGPWIGLYIYYYSNFRANPFSVFLDRLLYTTLFGPMLSLAAMMNLLLFFIFIWLNRDEGAMGVLLSTFLYGFVVFALKLFGGP